jgi:flagellar biosynthesis protein FlhF
MKLKSFYADSVEEALGDARREFGPEAVLVQSRRTTVEAKQFGEYEVVCALLPEDETAAVTAAPREQVERAEEYGAHPDVRALAGELAELRRCMERIQSSIALASTASATSGAPAPVREMLAALLAAEVEPELAQRIVGEAGTWAAGQTEDGDFIPGNGVRFSALVHRYITRLAAVRSTPGEEKAGRSRAIALVGPPGAGKTACIAKLAARQAIAMHRGAYVVALDEFRVGGSEQLRAYASILGIGFEALTHDSSLPAVIDDHAQQLVLVDVPGFSPAEMTFAVPVARRLQAQEVEVQLVLPASLRAADLRRVSKSFSVFRPAGLIFTRLDETETYGPLLNEIVRTGVPASFLADGPHVPDDLEPASRSRIADLVLSSAPAGTRAA